MPTTIGFNHVATVTPDADRLVAFYAKAFGAEVTFEMAEEDGHPRLVVLDLGRRGRPQRVRGRMARAC